VHNGAVRGGLPRAATLALAVLAGAPARAASPLKVEVPAAGCPRRKEVVASLEARLPGVTRTGTGAGNMRRLQVEATDVPAVVLLRLFDDREVVALERRLGGEASAGGGGCQALAEAVALVVDRYLREIGYRPPAASVPPPPEPPPTNEVAPDKRGEAPRAVPPPTSARAPSVDTRGAAATAQPPPPHPAIPAATTITTRKPSSLATATPSPSPSALYAGLAGGARLGPSGATDSDGDPVTRGELFLRAGGHAGHWLAELGAGASSELAVAVAGAPGAELRLRAFPLRLGVGGWWAAPAGALIATAGISADLVRFRALGLADARTGLRFDPAAELGFGYLLDLGRLFVRATLGGGLTLAPRDFDVGRAEPVYRTPAGYVRSNVEVGWTLWKK
jgi:hypothetical protein